jgi:myo-inositol-1(or 4)-monophosphatase
MSPSTGPAELRDLAGELARAAGDLALRGRRRTGDRGPAGHTTKSSATDPVTEHDLAAERLLVEELERRRPDDAIVGEEGATRAGTTGIEWQLDPIDGTANFVYDLPAWSTSVAAVDADGGLGAAVYAPASGELWSAARGRGALLDGRPIRVSAADDVRLALVATGFSYLPDRRRRQAERLVDLVPEVRDVRRFGSAALDLCMVACGRLDAYFEEHLNSWDLAAGSLIAAEAGAVVTGFDGGPPGPAGVVAAAPGIHAALLDLIARIDG